MDLKISDALAPMRVALSEVANESEKRRLSLYNDKIPCRPGCSHCCSRLVSVTIAEALVIYENLVQKGVWPEVRTEAKRQSPLIQGSDVVSWYKMNIPCSVLDGNGRCRTYNLRPAICSISHVTSDPEGCNPWSTKSVDYKPLDFEDLYKKFDEKIMGKFDPYGFLKIRLYLPIALLLAEHINIRSKMSVEDIQTFLYNEFQ